MNADALHAALSGGPLRAALLALITGAPLVAAALAGGRRSPAAAHGLRASLMVALVLLALARGLGALLPGGGAPLDWLSRLGAPTGGWYPVDATLLYAAGLALVQIASAPWLSADRPVPAPLHPGVAAAVGLSGPLAWIFGWSALSQQAAPIPALELWSLAPLVTISLALATQATPASPSVPPTNVVPPAAAGPPAAWRERQAVGDKAFLAMSGVGEQAASADVDVIWTEVGGVGPAPRALTVLRDRVVDPSTAWHVPDVADPDDLVLTAALVRIAATQRGARALVVMEEPAAWTHAAPPGGVTVGAPAMAAALASGRLPATWVISPRELAAAGGRLLVDPRTPEARAWRATLGAILLPRLDRMQPLSATHLSLALERLELVLSREGATWGLVSTGVGSPSSLAVLREVGGGREVQELALGPGRQPALSVWLADWRYRQGRRSRWAVEAAASAGAVLSDPGGTLDPGDLGADAPPALRRAVSFDGPASVAVLDARALVSAVRALPQRGWHGHPEHHALWGLRDDPVSRFLADADNLRGLAGAGRLHGPRVVVGRSNRPLLRAHLRAALAEAEHDDASLRAAFGPSVVDEERPATSGRWRCRRTRDGALLRSPILVMRPEAAPLSPTVTDQVIQLVDAASGAVLGHVDALCAPTRLYPRRVLDLGGHRYEVPLHALDPRRGRLELARVAADAPLTDPMLTTRLDVRGALEAAQLVRRGRLSFRLATFEAIVHEQVSGVRRPGGDRVAYAPVEARYRTRIRAIGFDTPLPPDAAAHLAASLGGVLRARLVVHDDDLGAVAVRADELPSWPSGVAVIDRNVQGLGIAEALDDAATGEALEWVYAILHRCACERGCARCTPAVLLDDGVSDKASVLTALGG